jgi:hypothetical protein
MQATVPVEEHASVRENNSGARDVARARRTVKGVFDEAEQRR